MYKQYRTDIEPGEGTRRLSSFWSEHWGGLDLETLEQGLERTDLWRSFRKWLPEGGRLLEAGCGPGHWVKFLGERGYRSVGVDLAEPALAASKQTAPELRLNVGDLAKLPFANGVFDAYVSLGVIEHFEDGPDSILSEAARVVRPGGTLMFSVPYLSVAKRWAIRRYEKSSPRTSNDARVFYQYVMTTRDLRRVLSRAGFEVVAIHPLEVEGGLQNRIPSIGALKQKIKTTRRSLVRRAMPAMHATWDLLIRMLPASALAHMIMAVCRKPR